MKRFTGTLIVIVMFLSVPILSGCDTKTKQENATLKAQVEQLTKDKADLQKRVDELTNESNTLKTENDQLKKQVAGATPAPGGAMMTPAPGGMMATPAPQQMPQ
jgi:outer membrane murein-binding lipoprotein Lpp